jgi:cytochrome c-type biogenesis protein CcmE
MEGNEFRCTQIQMKCPSKYKNDQVAVGNAS